MNIDAPVGVGEVSCLSILLDGELISLYPPTWATSSSSAIMLQLPLFTSGQVQPTYQIKPKAKAEAERELEVTLLEEEYWPDV